MMGFLQDDATGARSSTRMAMLITVGIPAFVFLVWGVSCLLTAFTPPSWEMVGLATAGPAVGGGVKVAADKIKRGVMPPEDGGEG